MRFLLPPYSKMHIIALASLTFFLAIGLLFSWKLYGEQITQTIQSLIPLRETNLQKLAEEEPEAVDAIKQGNFDVAINLHQFIILDVRPREQYQKGHLRGALSNPADQVGASVFSSEMKVAIYSTSDEEIRLAVRALQDKKVSQIEILNQPLEELAAQGYAIDTIDEAP